MQTQDEEFDKTVYVISDDPELLTLLTSDSGLRASLQELVQSGKYVQCSYGKLWVEVGDRGFDKSDTDEVVARKTADSVLRPLLNAKERIRKSSAQPWASDRDPRLVYERILLTTTAILGAVGLAFFFLSLGTGSFPKQIVHESIDRLALDGALVAAGALVALLLLALRSSSRTHLLFIEVLIVGVPSAWSMSQTYFDWTNRAYDTSIGTVESVIVSNKRWSSGKSKHFYLTVAGWPDKRADEEISVSRGLYESVENGQCAHVTLHPGHYNDSWISDFEPQAKEC